MAWKTQGLVSRIVDPTDMTPALRSLRRSLALDSTDAEAWHWLALSLAESGDLSGAIQAWRRSVAADPGFSEGLAFLSQGHYWRRQYDSAARWADSSIAVEPNSPFARDEAASIELERGDYTRAKADFEAEGRLSTDVEVVNALAGSALVEARGGDSRKHAAVFLAEAYAALGDAKRSVEWLRRYQPSNDLHFQLHLRCDPPFAPIEEDPRFRSMLVKARPSKPDGC